VRAASLLLSLSLGSLLAALSTSCTNAPDPQKTATVRASPLAVIERSPARSVRTNGSWSADRAAHPAWHVELPTASDGALVMHTLDAIGSGAAVRSEDARAVVGEPVAGALVFREAATSADRVLLAEPGRVEDLWVLHDAAAPRVLRWSLEAHGEVQRFARRGGYVVGLDAANVPRVAAQPIRAWNRAGLELGVDVELRDVAGGAELTVRLPNLGADDYPVTVDPLWTALSSSLTVAREGYDYTLAAFEFAAGVLVVVGGADDAGDSRSLDRFDPVLGVWAAGATMPAGHGHFFAVAATGQTLVVGGGYGSARQTQTTDVYDAAKDAWSTLPASGNTLGVHNYGRAVTLADGRILLVGGYTGDNGSTGNNAAEIFDPATKTWSPAGTNHIIRGNATRLDDGTVLYVGDGSTTVDRFYPATNAWSTVAAPKESLWEPAVLKLPADASGHPRVMVYGGAVNPALMYMIGWQITDPTRVGEVFDVTANSWSRTAPDPAGTLDGSTRLSLLPSNLPMRAGSSASTAAVTVYDPNADKWSSLGTLAHDHEYHVQLTTSSGDVYVIGGNVDGRAVGSTLVEKLTLSARGATCASDAECGSGHCADGVCCDSACAGACTSCNLPSKAGTCSPVDGAPDPHALCPAVDATHPCATGLCSMGACGYVAAGTACGAMKKSCTGNMLATGSTCNGSSASCQPSTTAACAGSLNCKSDGSDCLTRCASDADCAVGSCDTASGACGVVVDAGVDATADATADGSASDAAASDASASDASASDAATDASASSDASSTSDAAASFDIGAPSGDASPSVKGVAQKCTSASECMSGFCVDGVCCDSACTADCSYCAFPESPGKCVNAPAGIDMRGKCGIAANCQRTCGADGSCVTSGAGAQCAPAKCTGVSTGEGPGVCSATGSPCGAQTAFDCAPFACDMAFGACVGQCRTSTDCALGATCDTSSGRCVQSAATSSSGGCSTSPRNDGRCASGLLALTAALAFVARRRRRQACMPGAS
jgi:hypothetical protein